MGHILKSYDEDLSHLKGLIVKMMGSNLKQLNLLHIIFSEFSDEIQKKAVEIDTEINKLDAEIINEALKLFNLRSPVASDLRFVFSSSHISRNLERAGDQAKSIAKYAIASYVNSNKNLKIKYLEAIHILIEMLHLSIKAFDNMDVTLAKKLQNMDSKVDCLYSQMSDLIIKSERDNSADKISETRYHFLVSRNLERIGDHISVLGRYVEFVENNIILYG